ncbi:hypothetical protein RFI_06715 [Reticulomyxa filosa]|uniref:Uncharacterized protein n=1 Tax=Reticulomyxa filosa TaxID=46433 RepID=X6NWR7_RETFI|nr:hypothetical protein RFI_06715 [Reticulomyxa filosa]|eukprot:ETO30406.1 hypothetical protein RFI_06715 [Reticulomyxa filosa]
MNIFVCSFHWKKYTIEIKLQDKWFHLLCSAFGSDFELVMNNAGTCLVYFIAKLDLQKEQTLQGQYLKNLTHTLNADLFQRFSQFYIEICNHSDWEQETARLCIHFGQCVFTHNLDDFFFTSDIKVLVEIYERCLHNTNPSSKVTTELMLAILLLPLFSFCGVGMLWCLDAVHTILQWQGYVNVLECYHLKEIQDELDTLLNTAKEGHLHELVEKTNQVLTVAKGVTA